MFFKEKSSTQKLFSYNVEILSYSFYFTSYAGLLKLISLKAKDGKTLFWPIKPTNPMV